MGREFSITASPLGQLPDGWRLVKVKDITRKVGSGATPKGGQSVYLPARVRVALIRSQNVFDRHFGDDGLAYISDEHAGELAGAQVQPGDLLLNITGDGVTFARACLAPPDILPACVNQHVSIIRPDPSQCCSGYLLSYLTHPIIKEYIESFNAGGSRRAITKGHIESFEVPLPPLPEQRRIADILGTLDHKIELNRRMNETLEAMARALFKSWFVDFDPVRAKAKGKQPAVMGAETASLFSNAFVDSALGKVPEGWSVKPLPEAIEVNPTRLLAKDTVAPYLEMSNMPTSSARAIAWEMRAAGSGMRFVNGDVLLARITPCLENGKTAFVDFLGDGQVGWGSTEYIVLRSKSPLPAEYAYFLARTHDLRTHAIKNMTGTSGRQRVPAECFNSYLGVFPPEPVAERFGEWAAGVMQTMRAHDEQTATLAAIRDTLLPKLLSGEIRVGMRTCQTP